MLAYFTSTPRITDNPILDALGTTPCSLIAIVDTAWQNLVHGYPKRSPQYCDFSRHGWLDFKKQLSSMGHTLELFEGDPVTLLGKVIHANDIHTIITEHPPAFEEKSVLNQIQSKFPDMTIKTIWANTLLQPDALGYDLAKHPKVFTKFRHKVEAKATWPSEIKREYNINTQALIVDKALEQHRLKQVSGESMLVCPGESGALEHVRRYIFDNQTIKTYKKTRNQLLGFDFSTKFSPWLAHGQLSAAWLYTQIREFEANVVANESTYWVIFELLWRDFFRFTLEVHQNKLFHKGGLLGVENTFEDKLQSFERWASGSTGVDFVDANMIELNQTGYMSNRGRQNVASFLVHNLNQDWRKGASYFESKLLDYDVASNWGNWAYLAGVGNDPRSRMFNIEKQQSMYDPNREYIDYWLQKKA